MCCCKATNSLDWELDIDWELPTVETLRVDCKLSAVVLETPQTRFLSGPPDEPTSIHKSGRILDGSKYCPRISPSTDYYRSPENKKKKSYHHIQYNKHNNLYNNLQNKMVEQTYHEMLSTVINELLRPLLAVLTPHVRLHKQLHRARLTSKRRSL